MIPELTDQHIKFLEQRRLELETQSQELGASSGIIGRGHVGGDDLPSDVTALVKLGGAAMAAGRASAWRFGGQRDGYTLSYFEASAFSIFRKLGQVATAEDQIRRSPSVRALEVVLKKIIYPQVSYEQRDERLQRCLEPVLARSLAFRELHTIQDKQPFGAAEGLSENARVDRFDLMTDVVRAIEKSVGEVGSWLDMKPYLSHEFDSGLSISPE